MDGSYEWLILASKQLSLAVKHIVITLPAKMRHQSLLKLQDDHVAGKRILLLFKTHMRYLINYDIILFPSNVI